MNTVLVVIIILAILTIAFFFWYGSRQNVFSRLRRDVATKLGLGGFPSTAGGKIYIKSYQTGEYLSARKIGQIALKNTTFPGEEECFTYSATKSDSGLVFSLMTCYGKYIGLYGAGKVWAASSTVGAEEKLSIFPFGPNYHPKSFTGTDYSGQTIFAIGGSPLKNYLFVGGDELINAPYTDTSKVNFLRWEITPEK